MQSNAHLNISIHFPLSMILRLVARRSRKVIRWGVKLH